MVPRVSRNPHFGVIGFDFAILDRVEWQSHTRQPRPARSKLMFRMRTKCPAKVALQSPENSDLGYLFSILGNLDLGPLVICLLFS